MTKSHLQEQIINTEESVHAGDHEAEQRLPSMQFTFTSDLEASLDTMSRLHLNLLWFLSSPCPYPASRLSAPLTPEQFSFLRDATEEVKQIKMS